MLHQLGLDSRVKMWSFLSDIAFHLFCSSFSYLKHFYTPTCCCCHFAVLEAGDVASLLAQFEASEAVNTPGGDNPGPECLVAEGTQKQPHGAVATDSHQTTTTGTPQHKKPSLASPTHQNIKDALPKEIIEKIKGGSDLGDYNLFMNK